MTDITLRRVVAPDRHRPSRSRFAQGSGRGHRGEGRLQRSPARSSRTGGPGGRPPRVARKRKPGPSCYVWRRRRRCGSERESWCGVVHAATL